MKKKKTTKQIVKSLHNKCSKLWKQRCIERDGRVCQVKKHFPEIGLNHTSVLQVDHCWTRLCKLLFYEVSNGTVVCSGCNLPFNNRARELIRDIVKERESEKRFNEMKAIFLTLGGNPNFNKIWWLEEKLKKLEDK